MFFPYEGTKGRLQYQQQLVKLYPEIKGHIIKELF